MGTTVNFYLVKEDEILKPGKNELYKTINSNSPLYLNLKSGDTVILKDDNVEYEVLKSIKNLQNNQLNIYVTRIKSTEEVIDEIEDLANKTLKNVLDSIKDTFGSDNK
ncbi:hypothetical protein GTH52_05810 [Clostridium tyrobutyricum]|jgi:hypothetical protein|uniref:Uncharacterized protein n=1 Tax=Clostridium tyrobutyricum DIVETGP TaxID=1408889 RepID=W6NAX7_CLOTY|nr:hypothetical protein [Clostridium tyrobutyricum]AND84610.1 hypothetical protein CTK_C13490 [Clostridium tyrobutyricum]ANP69215.1 hypothetical protein BA182_05860 [Clostridium tyrobutyricum]MBR9648667.1 hypothetical protein [Clostridium tyrobutyricum]MBV4415595.1 hypothetical protein [Clostridium tyrobutyricum]MBV4425068.1 hypothetical protein [Clostridium tyrobutyricum]